MSNHKKVVHSQGRQIIYNVFKFMKEEKKQRHLKTSVIERVAKATGVGLSTVKRICKEAAGRPEDQKFQRPRKTIRKQKPKSNVGEFDEEIMHKVIYTYPSIRKRRPTMAAIFEAVKEDSVNFEGKLSPFRSVVQKLGFRWQKTEDNRKILIEKNHFP